MPFNQNDPNLPSLPETIPLASRYQKIALSYAQDRYWLLSLLEPNNSAYNTARAIRLDGQFNQTAFNEAVQLLAKRHEALCTVVKAEEGKPILQIVNDTKFQVHTVELLNFKDKEAAILDAIEEIRQEPFDLTVFPLVRFNLLRVTTDDHVVVIVTHRILIDEPSLDIMSRDLSLLYTNQVSGDEKPLPQLPLQFSDFASWQCEQSHGDGFAALIAYWKGRLSGELPVFELLTDYPRPPRTSYTGKSTKFDISELNLKALQQLCKETKTDFFSIFITALTIVLRKHTGQDDIILGVMAPNRVRKGTENLVGRLATLLPLRINSADNLPLRDFILDVHKVVTDAFNHQELPFERLLEELPPIRDLSRHPLFQVMVEQHNNEDSDLTFNGLSALNLTLERKSVMFDLEFSFITTLNGLEGCCTYNTSLYSERTIGSIVQHLTYFLKSTISDLKTPVSSLSVLDEVERHILIVERNPNNCISPEIRLVHELFEAQVVRTPETPAVSCANETLTYFELNRQANQLSRYLRDAGATEGSRIGICIDRSVEMMIAIIATLKTGCIYVPIDPAYPEERQSHMILDAEVSIVLTVSTIASQLPSSVKKSISLDTESELFSSLSGENLGLPLNPLSMMYMIFTSGSTGKPKGSLVYHTGFVNLLNWYVKEFEFNNESCFLVFSSLGFDLTQKNLFAPLISGGHLVLVDSPLYDPEYILDIIAFYRATTINCTPSAFYGLLSNSSDRSLSRLESLNIVVLGGEPISTARMRAWIESPYFHATFVNSYGPTECTDVVAFYRLPDAKSYGSAIPIGRPIPNVQLYVLDSQLQLVPDGAPGELSIGGICVGAGYVNRPELNTEKFVKNPFAQNSSELMYRTGDRVRYLANENIEFLGRIDHQVKLSGFRIELGEITNELERQSDIKEAYVMAQQDESGDQFLVAYIVLTAPNTQEDIIPLIRKRLFTVLPEYMVPTNIVLLEKMPISPNGKVDRSRLPVPKNKLSKKRALPSAIGHAATTPLVAAQQFLSERWRDLLHLEQIDVDDRFFELGGTSLKAIQFVGSMGQDLNSAIPMVSIFQAPTIAEFAAYLQDSFPEAFAAKFGAAIQSPHSLSDNVSPYGETRNFRQAQPDSQCVEIAIVGMSARVPGAKNLEEFWEILRDGVEAVRTLSDEELLLAGVPPELIADPDYVKAVAAMDDIEGFDAAFFGLLPREVELMDPQHRALLEGAWSALEHAGYASVSNDTKVGVFAGVARDAYFINNMLSHPKLHKLSGDYSLMVGNEKDFSATRISYQLNLKGPSVNVQSACSSAGVAIHLASQSLLLDECDLAIAGGCRVLVPVAGYMYVEGGTLSPDGHVRAFDAKGKGMIRGSGVCCVALKRLDRAKRDGDCIYAVIKGSAINNDGSAKVGFAAPSVHGQAEVIRQALHRANVDPETVSYVETHGTGTSIGDPIEVAALKDAYRTFTNRKAFCAIGSVKTNIGHLDAGSCAAGVVKTVLSLRHRQLPPSLNYDTPNPQIDFENSPFFVNSRLTDWNSDHGLRRAGVSSFGLGGTNVHLILEESIEQHQEPGKELQILLLSAKTATALETSAINLAEFLRKHPYENLPDIAYTLQVGRRYFEHRRAFVVNNPAEAVTQLNNSKAGFSGCFKRNNPSIVFMFPGQGTQHINMGRDLYEQEPVFKQAVDQCATILQTHLAMDIREILFPQAGFESDATQRLNQTGIAQPAIFTISFASAQLLLDWGVTPSAMIGHSVGEFAAACVAGVFSLEDTITVLANRAKLMQSMPPGSMRAVQLPEAQVRSMLPQGVALAACNAPSLCVVSGPHEAIAVFDKVLEERGLATGVLHTSHAFHSAMMDPMLAPFAEIVSGVNRENPRIPIVSTLTGTWMSNEEATSENYWADQLRQSVRFSSAFQELLKDKNRIYIECGPSTNLTGAARAHVSKEDCVRIINVLPHVNKQESSAYTMATAIARLWTVGGTVNWAKLQGNNQRRRIGLPTYPFERRKHWVEPFAVENPLAKSEPLPRGAAEKITGLTFAGEGQTSSDQVSSLPINCSNARPSDQTSVARIFQQQIELMSLQLGLLSGTRLTSTVPIKEITPDCDLTETVIPNSTVSNADTEGKKVFLGPQLRISKSQAATLTHKQRQYLDEFILRYNSRTKSSKEYAQAHRNHLADPRVVSGFKPLFKEITYPIVVNRSLGSKLWDIDGNEYVDMLNGFGSNYFGHRAPFVIEALEQQFKQGIEIGPQHPLAGELADELAEYLNHDRIAFCNTGSEAVLGAMRMARTSTGRDLIAMFTGAYHGIFDEVIVRGTRNQRSLPASPGIQPGAVSNILVLDYATPETLEILKQRSSELAAILVEPVQSRMPELQPREFLHDLRALTTKSGTALIFDEVVTGFRVGAQGAQGHFGLKADIAAYGKILGGGMNIGVIAGTRHFMDTLDGGAWQFGDDSIPEVGVTYFAGTFVRHPPVLAAAKAVLKHLKAEGPTLQQRVNEKTARLVHEINAYAKLTRIPVKLTHFTSIIRVAFTQEVPYGELLFAHLRESGVHIWDHRPVYMTAAHTDQDIDFVIGAFKRSFDELLKADILPVI